MRERTFVKEGHPKSVLCEDEEVWSDRRGKSKSYDQGQGGDERLIGSQLRKQGRRQKCERNHWNGSRYRNLWWCTTAKTLTGEVEETGSLRLVNSYVCVCKREGDSFYIYLQMNKYLIYECDNRSCDTSSVFCLVLFLICLNFY